MLGVEWLAVDKFEWPFPDTKMRLGEPALVGSVDQRVQADVSERAEDVGEDLDRCRRGSARFSYNRSLGRIPIGIVELAESRVRAGAVDRGGAAMHHDADTDRLSGLLLGGAGAGRSAGVRGDAAIAAMNHPDRHRDQFFDLRVESTRGQRGSAQFSETLVDIRNHLPQSPVLRIQLIEKAAVVLMCVFSVMAHQSFIP